MDETCITIDTVNSSGYLANREDNKSYYEKKTKEGSIMNKFDKLMVGLCQVVQLGSIIGLAAIGLKRNQDCYEAEMKLLERESDLFFATVDILKKDKQIEELEKELEGLKGEVEES